VTRNGLLRLGESGLAPQWSGSVRHRQCAIWVCPGQECSGVFRYGMVRDSKESGVARSGHERQSGVRRGEVVFGVGWVRYAQAWCDKAQFGQAGFGVVRQCQDWPRMAGCVMVGFGLEWSGPKGRYGKLSHGAHRSDQVWNDLVSTGKNRSCMVLFFIE
jgi:hypothetical protein